MSDQVTLKEYEDAEVELARRDARRGLLIHAAMCGVSVLVHYLLNKRLEPSMEARHRKIEAWASDSQAA